MKPLLAVIPARGGSKGLPGKNVRPLAGLPLIAHSLRLASMCPEIDRTIVSTDSAEIARVAQDHGGEVPFHRPAELATDDAAMIAVLQHALRTIERQTSARVGSLLLLDPTSPGRVPGDVTRAVALLEGEPRADAVVAVSEPEFNPLWHSVVVERGALAPLIRGGGQFTRRQDVPVNYRINGILYLFRRDFLLGLSSPWDWLRGGRCLPLLVPDERAVHIDDAAQLARAEALIRMGLVDLPWLKGDQR